MRASPFRAGSLRPPPVRRVPPAALVALTMLASALAGGPAAAASSHRATGPIVVTAGAARAVSGGPRSASRSSAGAAAERCGRSPTASPGPLTEPLTQDPLAPGHDNPASPPLYAPLSFTVGHESISQYQGLIWGGNLMAGSRSGIRYSARRVIAARAVPGRGCASHSRPSDPTGRG